MLWHLDTLLKENVEINMLIWFCCLEDNKECQGAEGAHLSEPQKAHPTSEFILVLKNGGCSLFHLVSCLVTVVSE